MNKMSISYIARIEGDVIDHIKKGRVEGIKYNLNKQEKPNEINVHDIEGKNGVWLETTGKNKVIVTRYGTNNEDVILEKLEAHFDVVFACEDTDEYWKIEDGD